MSYSQEKQDIKKYIGRAKIACQKKEYLKIFSAAVSALNIFIHAELAVTDKHEIEILLSELMHIISSDPSIKKLLPANFSYKKGMEEKLLSLFDSLHFKLESAMSQAQKNKTRSSKMELDTLLLDAEKLLDESNVPAGMKMLQKAVDNFKYTEQALLIDVGRRLTKRKLFSSAIPYFMEMIELYPEYTSGYASYMDCLEKGDYHNELEKLVLDTMRKFGATESLWVRLAKVYSFKGQWDKAYDASNTVLEINTVNFDALKIKAVATKHLFTSA